MEKKRYSGQLITFEGPEGGGKSTQINMLADFFRSKGKEVLVSREPGGTKLGSQIRGIILSPYDTTIGDRTEVLLFQADRAQHIKEIVLPALEKGLYVLCDRFIDSTIAYQVAGRGFPREFIDQLNDFSAYGVRPDLTLLLDVDYEIGIKRATKIASDRFENEDSSFHNVIRNCYLDIQKNEPDRVKLVNTSETTIATVHEDIKEIVKGKYDL